MKKKSINLLALLLSFILVLTQALPTVASANSNDSITQKQVSSTCKARILTNANVICIGQSISLKLSNASNWQIRKVISSNAKIAKVTKVNKKTNNATLKGVKEGKTKITFKLSNKKKIKKLSCNITVKKLLPSKTSINVDEVGVLSLNNIPGWKITKAVSANDDIASISKVSKTCIKFVGKAKGKTVFRITAKNYNTVKLFKTVIIVDDSKTIDPSITETVVGSPEELTKALKMFPNLNKLTIHTDQAETFYLEGNYPNLTVIFDAPKSEAYNSAALKGVDIYAIASNTWHEKGLNNIINLFSQTSHVVVEPQANNTTVNIRKDASMSLVESNSSTTVNIFASKAHVIVNGISDLTTINVKVGNVTLKADVVVNINLEVNAPLTVENTTGTLLNVKTPFGTVSVSEKTSKTITEISTSGNSGWSSSSSNSGCQHKWSEYVNIGEDGEIRTCESCKKEETRKHEVEETISYEQLKVNEDMENAEDTKHCKTIVKQCKNCDYHATSSVEELCTVNWQYSAELGLDISVCICGIEKTRNHIHSDPPEDLNYDLKNSNNDGSHVLQATYTCECQQDVTVTKSENCVFGEPTIEKNPHYNYNHIHLLVSTCEVCGYQLEENDDCVIDESISKFYMNVNGYLCLVRICSLCKGEIYYLHTEHILGDWFAYDEWEHRRECECTEFREEEDHTFGDYYDNNLGGFQCDKCGYIKLVEPHDHGHGLAGTHSNKNIMMDIVMNKPAYNECLSMSPINNPDSSSGDYCYRFDFKCQTCLIKYSAYVDHNMQDGVCTRCNYVGTL